MCYYRVNGQPFATLTDPSTNVDVGKALVADGILLFEKRRERKLAKLVRIRILQIVEIFIHLDKWAKLESLVTSCGKFTVLC